MPKNLVIVESPAKAKTIERFLGKDYQVESSFGHIADLPSKELGVDVENDFKPKYTVDKEKKALVKKLKDLAKKADTIWLASDEDREGEAISWHLAEELGLEKSRTKRIVFNSITKSAIQKAIENPREINYNLVNAQQARRVLDRLVGYELSPVLWKKIKPGLSAGRVQSVAVRLIVEREREIEAFKPEASFRIKAEFKTSNGNIFSAKLNKTFVSKEAAEVFLKQNIGSDFSVANLDKKPAKKSPAAPFTTSTLQQEASRKLYFSVGRTMQVAQRLYEAGLITYMRTDSVNLSKEALDAAKDAIVQNYGESYSKVRNFTGKSKGAQEAHEAVRPTDMKLQSPQIERDQAKLYELIWKRTLASQMSDAELERTNVKIKASSHKEEFTANGEVVKFDGFLKVYLEGTDEEDKAEEQEGMLPAMSVGEALQNNFITATERFSRPPYRYTEASLVKKLEELGIGRPSTYAPTISTIQNRGYAEKGSVDGTERNYVQLVLESGQFTEKNLSEMVGSDKGKLVPTDIGMIVNDFLVSNFTTILDYNFTAKVEENFDEIASGEEDWQKMMKDFYKDFHPKVLDVEENAERASGERILGTDPKSGRQVAARLGRFGPMVQIGTVDEEEKPLFASLLPEQSITTITFEEAMELFQLPRKLGTYAGEEVEASVGRFGPYVRFGKKFISLAQGESAFDVDMERAIELIKEKEKADAPIAHYEDKEVTKGKGRFGPFIKWDGMFINVNKKYDFDNLSQADIIELIEAKKIKEIEKLIQEWPAEKIRIEKARWGRHNIIKGKIKVELSKDVDATKISLEEAQALIEKKAPKKKPKQRLRSSMAFDFLVPIKDRVLAFSELLPPQALGKNIFKHTEKKGLPVFANATVAIFGVLESRNGFEKKPERLNIDEIRIQLYRLMSGNWNSTILDIGDIEEGNTVEDTYFVVKEIVAGLLEENIIPIVIGATQDITFPTYRAFDNIRDMVNLVSIDSRFDFGEDEELISSHSYMSKIITDKPNNLFNFSNIGYQSYFNAQEEIDLMERLFFDAYRLGEIAANLELAEPVLRSSHIVSLDLRAIRASEMGSFKNFSPNGFTGREICAIARYAGISDKVSLFGIYEGENSPQAFQMIAQIIWYFIEGISFRIKEFPSSKSEDFTKFTVPTDTEELVFYKSHVTERWWVEVPSILPEHTKTNSAALLPCTEEDYLDACNQKIPERWFKAYRKGFN